MKIVALVNTWEKDVDLARSVSQYSMLSYCVSVFLSIFKQAPTDNSLFLLHIIYFFTPPI